MTTCPRARASTKYIQRTFLALESMTDNMFCGRWLKRSKHAWAASSSCAGSLAHPFEKRVVFLERICQGASTAGVESVKTLDLARSRDAYFLLMLSPV